MSDYRRLYVPGGTYFFTVVTARRAPLFADEANVARLRTAFRRTISQRPFRLLAACVLPDHLHCVWTLPTGDTGFPARWKVIKTCFTRALTESGERRRVRRVWQPRYREHAIRDENDLVRHLDYLHFNPVRHGLVKLPSDWPHSSLHRFINRGFYAPSWGATPPAAIEAFTFE